MKLKDHIFRYDEVVIGGTLSALTYAYLNNLTLFFTRLDRPFRFDFFDKSINLETFDLQNKRTILKTVDGQSSFGMPKFKLYDDLMFNMSLSGLLPFSSRIESITLNDNNMLNIVTHNSRLIKVLFNKLTIFCTNKLKGLSSEPEQEEDELYKVVDWINVRSGMKHGIDLIETNDNFIKKIFFFPSDRICGNHDKKDAASVSHMTKQQLSDLDFSEIYIKFKAIELMKQSGIRGTSNGKSPSDSSKTVYRSIKIEIAHREIEKVPPAGKNIIYDNITFNRQTFKDICKSFDDKHSYLKKIRKILNEGADVKR